MKDSGPITFTRGLSQLALDITFCSHRLPLDTWSTIDSATSGDHFHILFVVNTPSFNRVLRSFSVYNRSTTHGSLSASFAAFDFSNSHSGVPVIVNAIRDSIKLLRLEARKYYESHVAAWWNEDCGRAYRPCKAAWEKLLVNCSFTKLFNFHYYRAMFKRTVSIADEAHEQRACRTFQSLTIGSHVMDSSTRSRLPPLHCSRVPSLVRISDVLLSRVKSDAV